MAASQAWFHFLGSDRAVASSILKCLALVGLPLAPLEARGPDGNGIVLFSEIDEPLLNFLRDAQRANSGCVLALCASSSQIKAADSWRLLHAGAAEVVAWNKQPVVVEQIKARLERWSALAIANHLVKDLNQ